MSSPRADLDAGRALSDLIDVEAVSMAEVLRLCRGELDRAEIERLMTLELGQSVFRRLSEGLPKNVGMIKDGRSDGSTAVGRGDVS